MLNVQTALLMLLTTFSAILWAVLDAEDDLD